jgi:hypothetical protein
MIKIAATMYALLMLPAFAAEQFCKPLVFDEDSGSLASVNGRAPTNDVVCYRFQAQRGQTAHLVLAGNNVVLTVVGIGEGKDNYKFRTEGKMYQAEVGQLTRSDKEEPFRLLISLSK